MNVKFLYCFVKTYRERMICMLMLATLSLCALVIGVRVALRMHELKEINEAVAVKPQTPRF
jgi:hypothetical protein